jgi:hypothetical protein
MAGRGDECVCRCALRLWTREGVRDPSVTGSVLSEDEYHREEGEVAWPKGVRYHEYYEAYNGDGNRINEEPKTATDLV